MFLGLFTKHYFRVFQASPYSLQSKRLQPIGRQ